MSLVKYLARLASKGPAEEKLADSLGQRMRLEIASRFEDLDPKSMMGAGKPATEMRLKAMESSMRKADHAGVSGNQWEHAVGKVQEKLDDSKDFGKWTSIGQPTKEQTATNLQNIRDHYRLLRRKEDDIYHQIGQHENSLYADPVPKSLREKRARIGEKLNHAYAKESDASELNRWLRDKSIGDSSRPIKLRDHKSGITKDSLARWIKKNQGGGPGEP